MANSNLATLTVRFPEEANNLFCQLWDIQKKERPTLTKGAYLEEVINAYANPKTGVNISGLHENIERLQEENTCLQKENTCLHEENISLQSANTCLHEENTCLHENIDKLTNSISEQEESGVRAMADIEAENRRLQEENMCLHEENTELKSPKSDVMKIQLSELHRALLIETTNRLSEKLGRKITAQDILLDMFVRYTVERWNEWFYPFVIQPRELKELTGYSEKEIINWLHSK